MFALLSALRFDEKSPFGDMSACCGLPQLQRHRSRRSAIRKRLSFVLLFFRPKEKSKVFRARRGAIVARVCACVYVCMCVCVRVFNEMRGRGRFTCRKAHIISEAASCAKRTSFAFRANIIQKALLLQCFLLAGIERFELSQTESKSVVLPLHNIPSTKDILSQQNIFVNNKLYVPKGGRPPGRVFNTVCPRRPCASRVCRSRRTRRRAFLL